MPTCKTCRLEGPLVKGRKECQDCRRKYYRSWYKNNREDWSASVRSYGYKLRAQALDAYGAKCECCGETEPVFLALDHINNDGKLCRTKKHRRKGYGLYLFIVKNNYPKGIQILCFNCNCAKAHYGGCFGDDMTPTRKYTPKNVFDTMETPMPDVIPTHPNFI